LERDVEVGRDVAFLDEEDTGPATVPVPKPIDDVLGEFDVVSILRQHHLVDEEAVIREDHDPPRTQAPAAAEQPIRPLLASRTAPPSLTNFCNPPGIRLMTSRSPRTMRMLRRGSSTRESKLSSGVSPRSNSTRRNAWVPSRIALRRL